MGLLTTYWLTIFLGASLLFFVQPLFARMVLPPLGGSPAVWNTCMLFFQGALLAGYGYAHASVRLLGPRLQAALHLLILYLVLLLPDIGIPDGWSPPADGTPVFWLLLLLTVSVGAPFFAVSSTSPLLQKWFANCDHSRAADPYFLYVASNVGSMLALIGYPLAVERTLRLSEQSTGWRMCYLLFVALMTACAILLWRSGPVKTTTISWKAEPVSWSRRLRWTALAFVPSSWMLGVTTFLTTDITPMPLLWVIPLALYLLTFILAFAARPPIPHVWMARLFPWAMMLLTVALILQGVRQAMLLHLAVFFVGATTCHGELAADRPGAGRLTEFYLWISFGGFLGGVFNGLIAPIAFPLVLEYPLTLALACWLRPSLQPTVEGRPPGGPDNLQLLVRLLGLFVLMVAVMSRSMAFQGTVLLTISVLIGSGLLLLCCYLDRPRWFAVVIATVMLVEKLEPPFAGESLHVDRGFFGVHRVVFSYGRIYRLVHGVTVHGIQNRDLERPELRHQPMAYYHRSGPLGQIFAQLQTKAAPTQVAVVGLGAGATACYCGDEQYFTFYEIDPIVQRIAETPEYFTYLSDLGRDHYTIVLGDGRLKLKESRSQYDLMVFDAFSSDAIPTHLLTVEAFEIYLDKLADGGVLAFHITNNHLDLEPVLADLARKFSLLCYTCKDLLVTEAQSVEGKTPSIYVAMARQRKDLAGLDQLRSWTSASARGTADGVPWTDDFSNILDILKW